MKNLYQLGNALSVYGVLCMQPEIDHVTMYTTNDRAEINIYADFHAPLLQNLKKELLRAVIDNCTFEMKHFEGTDDREAFSVLNLTWVF